MKKTILYTAMVAALGVTAIASVGAQAATLNTGDTLTISPGVIILNSNGTAQQNVNPGSWFGMDTNGNSAISGAEKTAISQGTTGLVIGTTTAQGSYHGGAPTAGDTNAITAPWSFFSNTGSDYLTIAATGGTTGINLSGWNVAWNTVGAINMGGGAWGAGYTSGVANFVWDGVYGHTYTLDYHATVPNDGTTNFGNVKYALHLEGTVVKAVPIPAAVWLLGSGLVGLVGVARRRKNVV